MIGLLKTQSMLLGQLKIESFETSFLSEKVAQKKNVEYNIFSLQILLLTVKQADLNFELQMFSLTLSATVHCTRDSFHFYKLQNSFLLYLGNNICYFNN